jgi:hypothetical protein
VSRPRRYTERAWHRSAETGLPVPLAGICARADLDLGDDGVRAIERLVALTPAR